MRAFLGHTVANGQLRFASVSSVKLFDRRTKGGCPRRWFTRYVRGEREPESDYQREAKEAGIALDAELKRYLLTGDMALSPLAIKGLHILEQPGPGLAVDVAINTVTYRRNGQPFAPLPDGTKYPADVEVIIESQLTAHGVPFVGELDVVHSRGHYRDDEGAYHADPPNTIEVGDIKWKGTAKDRYGNSTFMSANDLVRDIQMAGYGEWVARVRPSAQHVRLSHLYFPKKGELPTKVTKLHVLDDCRRTWEYVDGTVRDMQQVARETDIERVPGTDRSNCDAYSGCPYRETCSAYKQTSLDNIYGKVAADHLKEKSMGIIASNPQLMQGAQQAAPAPQPNVHQQLAQEEAQMRAQVAQQQQQMPQPLNTAELAGVCQRLIGFGFGFPTLAGNAAQAYALMGGQRIQPGSTYPGMPAPAGAQRSVHHLTLTEVAHIYQLADDLARSVAPQQMQPQAHTPPLSAPQGQPLSGPDAYTAAQVFANSGQAFAQSVPTATLQYTPVSQPLSANSIPQQLQANGGFIPPAQPSFILPPDAPQSMPQLAQEHPKTEAPATEEPKKTRGRPKKVQDAAPEVAAPPAAQTAAGAPPQHTAPATQVPPAAESAYTPPVSTTAPVEQQYSAPVVVAPDGTVVKDRYGNAPRAADSGVILINARGLAPTKSLAGYVDYINGELAKRYNVTADGKPGIQDVRCSPKDSPLAFGGWKGAVREVVKADPPPAAAYHLDTFTDELNEAVADALRVVSEQRGWLYVRAVRS